MDPLFGNVHLYVCQRIPVTHSYQLTSGLGLTNPSWCHDDEWSTHPTPFSEFVRYKFNEVDILPLSLLYEWRTSLPLDGHSIIYILYVCRNRSCNIHCIFMIEIFMIDKIRNLKDLSDFIEYRTFTLISFVILILRHHVFYLEKLCRVHWDWKTCDNTYEVSSVSNDLLLTPS